RGIFISKPRNKGVLDSTGQAIGKMDEIGLRHMSVNHVIAAIMIVLVVMATILVINKRCGFKLTNKQNEKGADKMSIKMMLPNGSVIEGTAEELAELNEIINGKEQAEEETFSKPAQVGDTIRITDAHLTHGEYEDGDVLTV